MCLLFQEFFILSTARFSWANLCHTLWVLWMRTLLWRRSKLRTSNSSLQLRLARTSFTHALQKWERCSDSDHWGFAGKLEEEGIHRIWHRWWYRAPSQITGLAMSLGGSRRGFGLHGVLWLMPMLLCLICGSAIQTRCNRRSGSTSPRGSDVLQLGTCFPSELHLQCLWPILWHDSCKQAGGCFDARFEDGGTAVVDGSHYGALIGKNRTVSTPMQQCMWWSKRNWRMMRFGRPQRSTFWTSMQCLRAVAGSFLFDFAGTYMQK